MEKFEDLINRLDKQDKKYKWIICPFFNYNKTSQFDLFFDSNSELKIKLSCHNHILSLKSYLNYFFDNSSSKIDNTCEYKHYKKIKANAYCSTCKCNICNDCLNLNHKSHQKHYFSYLIKDKDLIIKEFKENSKKITALIENNKNNLNKLSLNKFKNLENLFLIYVIERISYIEYLKESENNNFSFGCLMNLNYIRSICSKINFESIVNEESNENLFNLKKNLNKDNLFVTENIFEDDNIFKKEKIELDSKKCVFFDGNDAYIILVSKNNYIFIYSFNTKKLLLKISESESINSIRFSPDDYNLFICSTDNKIKIYKIENTKCEILKKIELEKNANIEDTYFIPKNNDNILVVNENYIKIVNISDNENILVKNLEISVNYLAFSNDGKILGYSDDKFLNFYEMSKCVMNKLNIIKEKFIQFHIRKRDNNLNYNLIIININDIKYYNDIFSNKFEKIELSEEVCYSYYDNYYDFLYLYTDVLTIIQISNWNRILQIKIEKELIPLDSFRIDSSLIKGFISLLNIKKKILYKYSFFCSKLENRNENKDSKAIDDNYLENKITKLSNSDFSFIHNIIDTLEIKKKKYLNIEEIKEQLDFNFKYSLPDKKLNAKTYFQNFKKEGTIYEQYINLVKIIINDNVDKTILTKYLLFLFENKDSLTDENIDSFEDEIKYYKVCFTQQELLNIFKFKKDNDEKTEFLLLLNKISNRQVTEGNITYIFKDLEEIKENLSTFNQPIEFSNKELYFYMNKATLTLEILKKKEKQKIKSIINMQKAIKLSLERKLFENIDIIDNESKFSKLMLILLRGQDEEITIYNLNLLNEIDYTTEEKKELLLNMNKNLFLKTTIIPGLTADISNIQINQIDSKFNFSNIVINIKNDEVFKEYELYNEEELLNYFKSKIELNKIKKFMKNILLSNCIKEAFEILYEEKYKYPFTNYDEASDYVDRYIDFIVLKDNTAKGATNKYNLQTKIFLKKCKEINPKDMSENILYGCLYSALIIKIFIHELNHEFYNFYFYHSNCSIPLSTPRKDNINEREGGKLLELLLFKKTIGKIDLNQALYILNRKNYDKKLSDFSEDFQSPKESDLIIEGEFMNLNEEITGLKKENEQFTNYYLKTDEDKYIDFNELSLEAEIEDDVIGSYI